MPHYVSLLRGINVSGKNCIKMDELRTCYEELGYNKVKTYVQSGNVLFSASKADRVVLAQTIALQIQKVFGFSVPVLVIGSELLTQIIKKNPFTISSDKDPSFFHVTFLASPPEAIDHKIFTTKKEPGEEFKITNEAVYLYCPHGYGRTKLNNNFIESTLKTSATTRNWKTVCEIQRMLSSHP